MTDNCYFIIAEKRKSFFIVLFFAPCISMFNNNHSSKDLLWSFYETLFFFFLFFFLFFLKMWDNSAEQCLNYSYSVVISLPAGQYIINYLPFLRVSVKSEMVTYIFFIRFDFPLSLLKSRRFITSLFIKHFFLWLNFLLHLKKIYIYIHLWWCWYLPDPTVPHWIHQNNFIHLSLMLIIYNWPAAFKTMTSLLVQLYLFSFHSTWCLRTWHLTHVW